MTQDRFNTERLYMKLTSVEDAAFIYELLNTESWLKFIGDRGVTSIEKAKQYIEDKMLPQAERLGYGNYTVHIKENDVKIGTCGLYDRQGMEGVDIGFSFLPAYEGKGYGYESSSKLLSIGINDFGLELIKGITVKENFRSQRLLEKLGLKQVGTVTLEGDDTELLLYQITSAEYKAKDQAK